MKKIWSVLVAMVFTFALVGCGNATDNKNGVKDSKQVDTVAVDSIDSIAVDSTMADTTFVDSIRK